MMMGQNSRPLSEPVLLSWSRIILVELEPQCDASPALPAPNLMFNLGRLSKMPKTKTISYFSHSISY
jgi:hypothetical protein